MAELDIKNLVLNDINIDTITNESKTGVFDKLMEAVNDNITKQYEEGRIDSSDFASVYLGSMQSVLSESVQFALQEQLLEAQTGNAITDNAIKEEQLRTAYTDRVLKDKQVAKLGLDNVMKNSESARDSDPDHIYSPQYNQE